MTAEHRIDEHSHSSTEHPPRDWPYRRTTAMRYGVAVLAVMVAFAIRYLIYGDLLNRVGFAFFVPAALVAAWYGGLGPGILATMLGLLIVDFFYLPPRHALWPLGDRELIAVSAYTITTTLCVILCENLHRRIRRLEHALHEARHQGHPRPQPGAHEPPLDATNTH